MTPVLYILMRTDMASMNPGKAMAHAAHAANQFQTKINNYFIKLRRDGLKNKKLDQLYFHWKQETGLFGTTITLGAPIEAIRNVVNLFPEQCAGIVHDPSYPLRDGDVLHLIPLDTCGYIFCDKETEAAEVLSHWSLHP